ncbi:hypothetical protein [Cupriavidus sp. D39]|uniref:hypothetical protein n=1 Tax=Cupriavidus sp. D39 TaxID=2997877 RepID=UPI002270515D|nr:hypothetical protein [Cupriavidus sp. D39]MCY0852652.1 hypothetical protein [Cupriavidus sp. D39]
MPSRTDITKHEQYGQVLQSLYGGVSDNADFLGRVQSLVVQSGKSPDQWFQDQRTLLTSGDKAAKQLFNLGNSIAQSNQTLAKRQGKDSGGHATVPHRTGDCGGRRITCSMCLASQNSDVLQLMSAKAQSDATKDQKTVAADPEATNAAQQIQTGSGGSAQQASPDGVQELMPILQG